MRSKIFRKKLTGGNGFEVGASFRFVLAALLALQFFDRRAQAQASGNALIQLMMSQPSADISSPVVATVSLDPPVIQPGEKSIYRVTFNATQISIQWPEEIPVPPPLKLQRRSSGQIMQTTGSIMRPLTTFNYEVSAPVAGQFTLPEVTVEVYGKPVVVPAAQLEVRTEAPAHEPARQLLLEPATTNLYVGETLRVRVLLLADSLNTVEGLSQVELNGEGFVVDKNSVRQSIQMADHADRKVGAYIYETSLTPIAVGSLKLSAQGFTSGMQFGGPIAITGRVTIPGGPPKYILLDSEPVNIRVRALPVEGELPGFAGAVGSYTCDAPQLATNTLRVGDPVQLNVVFHGQQNLQRLIPPPPPRVPGWQIFPPARAGLVGQPGTSGYGAAFSYTLIPMSDEIQATPAIPFSCFDPRRGTYVDLTIQPVAVTVISNSDVITTEASAMLDETAPEPEQKSELSKFAQSPGKTADNLVPVQLREWFPIVLLLPVLGFGGLWFWDHRRRFLELHPEIARRHHARRELRRVRRLLNHAAVHHDVSGFRQRAVRALQIVSAPHYPADPQALVGGDVLKILDAHESAGRAGEIVRHFFAEADEISFAKSSTSNDELLGWQADLNSVLSKLEARL